MKKELIYLASPYSSSDSAVSDLRFRKVTRAAFFLIKDGYLVFSPIAHSHHICKHGMCPDFDAWKEFDYKMIEVCDLFWVLKLDGYIDSVGVNAEIAYANQLGKPVEFIDFKKEWE